MIPPSPCNSHNSSKDSKNYSNWITPPELEDIINKLPEKPSEHPGLVAQAIYREWLIEAGHSYFFLFRKNASATNIQFSELLALLRQHAAPSKGNDASDGSPISVQFSTSEDFKEYLASLLQPLQFCQENDKVKTRNICNLVLNAYRDFLCNTIIVDFLFGSAIIHVPPTLTIEESIHLICGQSGYILSCGDAIYVRNTDKARETLFIKKLANYLIKKFPKGSNKGPQGIQFIPYADEFFSTYETTIHKKELQRGLHDVKLFLDKFFFENQSLVAFLGELPKRLRRQLKEQGDEHELHNISIDIAKGDIHYRKERDSFSQQEGAVTETSLWLLVDRPFENINPTLGDRRYYICYAHRYKNNNPFLVMNQASPAWVSPITLPHTLASAMLNLGISRIVSRLPTANHHKTKTKISIFDPFSGSGTTLLETSKFANQNYDIKFIAYDIHPLSQQLIIDNCLFYSQPSKYYSNLKNLIDEFLSEDYEGRRERVLALPPPSIEIEGWPVIEPKKRKIKEEHAIEHAIEDIVEWAIKVLYYRFPALKMNHPRICTDDDSFTKIASRFELVSISKDNLEKDKDKEFLDNFSSLKKTTEQRHKDFEDNILCRILFYRIWFAFKDNIYDIWAAKSISIIKMAILDQLKLFSKDVISVLSLYDDKPYTNDDEVGIRTYSGLYGLEARIPQEAIKKCWTKY